MQVKMKDSCILCGKTSKVSKYEGRGEYYVECNTCKNYSYDSFFKDSYKSMEKDKKAMVSAHTRECYERGKNPPKLKDPDNLEDKINEFRKKTIDEKVKNLILYLRKNSKYLGDSVLWDAEKDYPITYSPNPLEFLKIRDIAKKKGLLYWKSRDSGLELTGDGWEMAGNMEKESEMTLKEKREQFLLKLYEMSHGDINKFIDSIKIGEKTDIDRETTFNFVRYFIQKGFIKSRNDADNTISITPEGIDVAERTNQETLSPSLPLDFGNDVFLVHGHDVEAKETVARFIEKLELEVIILHELSNIGRTIIEKFEDHSNVGFAVVLLTPDDLGTSKDKKEELNPRARQNVIFELGYFIGKLGRKRVCVLYKEQIELPSDYEGILYVKMDKGGGWKQNLAREMKEAGMKLNLNKFFN